MPEPDPPSRTGGDALVEVLQRLGVTAGFGVASIHNLPLVDAIDRNLRWVPTRTEAGAVNAADGYARAADGLGCAVTSTGTGAGNAAGALVEALTAGSPILHVTGQIEARYLGRRQGVIHETKDQLGMLAAVSASASTITSAEALVEVAAGAVIHPRGPVSVEWPIDAQYRAPDVLPDPPPPPDRDETDAADLATAASLLATARRPLVWLGGGARWYRAEVDRMVATLGAGVLTSNAGRGTLPESTDVRVIGNFASNPACADLLAACDLLLSIGTHFRSNETRAYRLPLPTPHIQIDVDPAAIGRVHPADVGLVGEAGPVLERLVAAMGGSCEHDPAWPDRVAEVRWAVRRRLTDDIGPYAQICRTLNTVLPAGSNLVRDVTVANSSWGNRLLAVDDPTTNISPRGSGIGQAIGLAIGAAIARPDRHTLALMGDGGLQAQVGELATVRQEDLDLTLVVFDDGGYGVLRNVQDAYVGRRAGVDLFTPDFEAVARAHGLAYQRIESPRAMAGALSAMVAADGPGMIHVDCDKIGPMPVPFVPQIELPEAR